MLAEMAINLELARLMTYRAADYVDMGKRGAYYASIAKVSLFLEYASIFLGFCCRQGNGSSRKCRSDFWWKWL
jgi:hypothetical protein